jgi:undecaprenyl-diphosphatase
MIEQLEGIDRSLVLAINSIHSSWLDEFMWLVSGKLIWFPFYLLLLFLFFKKSNIRLTFIFLLCAIAVVALADQLSVHLFKNVFERYRPSHHALLTDKLHFYQLQDGNFYKGGMFGFVSSHAANFFGICSFAFLALKDMYSKIGWILFPVAILVCFSRVYLGVHYVTDIVMGGMLGTLLAIVVYKMIFIRIIEKYKN